MKNIRLTTNDPIVSLAPPPVIPGPPFNQQQPIIKQTYSISFNAQFETEVECLSFASKLLNMVEIANNA